MNKTGEKGDLGGNLIEPVARDVETGKSRRESGETMNVRDLIVGEIEVENGGEAGGGKKRSKIERRGEISM